MRVASNGGLDNALIFPERRRNGRRMSEFNIWSENRDAPHTHFRRFTEDTSKPVDLFTKPSAVIWQSDWKSNPLLDNEEAALPHRLVIEPAQLDSTSASEADVGGGLISKPYELPREAVECERDESPTMETVKDDVQALFEATDPLIGLEKVRKMCFDLAGMDLAEIFVVQAR